MRRPKILVVGSFVMDTTSRTKVFPAEGQTVLGESYTTAPGGKGANQSMAAALLGADVTMVGKVGRDGFGDRLIESLRMAGVNTEHVQRSEGEISSAIGNVIVTVDDDGDAINNRIIVIPGANMKITPEDVAFLETEIADYDFVILQFEIPMKINEIITEYAYRAGVPIMVNPAPICEIPEMILKHADYISPNETEASVLLGCDVNGDRNGFTAAKTDEIRRCMRKKNISRLLITLGKAGAVIITEDDYVFCESAAGIRAVDPTAAGDSFVGAFCTARCFGFDEADALSFSNMIAAVTVSFPGAQPSLPTLDKAIDFHEKAGRNVSLLLRMKSLAGNRVLT